MSKISLRNISGALTGLGTKLLVDSQKFTPTVGPTIEQIRSINWSKQFLWDFKFIQGNSSYDLPVPFLSWYPAVDIEDNLANVENLNIQGIHNDYEIPKSAKLRRFKLTFVDDQRGTLVNWFRKWMSTQMFGEDFGYVQTLDKAARRIQYQKLTSKLQAIQTFTYDIIPASGASLTFIGSSTADLNIYSLDFTIVGSNPVRDPGKESDPVTKWKMPGTNINPFF